jgi:hypothetical protein
MISQDRIVCAEGILRCGQEKDEARSGTTDEAFDEAAAQNAPALWVALRLTPAASRRLTDGTASLFAALLADRLAETQRKLFLSWEIML